MRNETLFWVKNCLERLLQSKILGIFVALRVRSVGLLYIFFNHLAETKHENLTVNLLGIALLLLYPY